MHGRCEHRLCARAPRAPHVGVEFGSKVLLVDCLLWKTITMAKISITERAQAFPCTRKLPSVTIQGNITAMRYRNDVIRWVLLLHIRANLRIMLARNFASCHVARNTLVMLEANNVPNLRWPAISLDLNPIDHLLDLLKRKVRAQPMELNLREFTLVIHRMCAAIQHQYIHRHILSMSTRYLAVDATPGGCTKYWNEIKYDVIWICSFCVKGVPVNPLI